MHPGLLILLNQKREIPDQYFIDAYFPLSIAGRVSANLAFNPETFNFVTYSEPHRKYPSYGLLNTDGNVDMYRWEYIQDVTDVPTLCDRGFRN